MSRIRTGSGKGVKRPFQPSIVAKSDSEQVADALDSIARSLATIDHNLEVLTGVVGALLQEMQLKN